MLTYAFEALRSDEYRDLASEDFTHIADLFAAILAIGIGGQVKRGLTREYIETTDTLSSPRGKIIFSDALRHKAQKSKQLTCVFDEFTANANSNQILKATMQLLLRSPGVKLERRKALRRLLAYFQEIDDLNIRDIRWDVVRYHKGNATYKMLITLCRMVIDGQLLTEQGGAQKLTYFLDDTRMHKLFERFVLSYYRRHFPEFHAEAATIDWQIDVGRDEFLPTMKTDITLKCGDKTLIIDTKYYSNSMAQNTLASRKTLHSNNLYQIFAYVKNKDKANSGMISGLLLYAKTDEEITPDSDYIISGNRIGAKTLALDEDFEAIEMRLRSIAEWLN